MHLTEGFTHWGWTAGGFVVALAAVADGLRHLETERIPEHAVLTSGFFAATLIHLPAFLGSSVHLLLIGLMGSLLGRSAGVAIFVALALQAILFGHGSLTMLGLNTTMFVVPAFLCAGVFSLRRRLPAATYYLAFAAGVLGVVGAGAIFGLILHFGGQEQEVIARTVFLAHLPIALLEGFVTVGAIKYLVSIKPELLA